MTLAPRSLKCLEGVHPDLVRVVRRADELGARFHVTCGLRTPEQQRALVAAGKSRTLKSRHLTGHAVDFVVAEPGGGVSYEHDDMAACAAIFKQAAGEMGVPLEWGGDWKSFVDTPHLQLPVKQYPAGQAPRSDTTGQDRPAVASQPVPIPAGPLARSKTMWMSGGATVATILGVVHEWLADAMEILTQAATMFQTQGPARDMLAEVGGNLKAVTAAAAIGCIVTVMLARIRAKIEGKPG